MLLSLGDSDLESKDNVQGEAGKKGREPFLQVVIPSMGFLDPTFPEPRPTLLFPQFEPLN